MKKVKLYLIGQKYEIELEDKFYDYIKNDINKINNSNNQIKDLLNLILDSKYNLYENEEQLSVLLNKIIGRITNE